MIHVVVHSYYPWFKFYVPFIFLSNSSYIDHINYHIQKHRKTIFFPRIKLNHNIHNLLFTKKTKHETSS